MYPTLGLAPDADPSIIGVLTDCSGVIPSMRGMKGAPSPITGGIATLAATCQGTVVTTLLDGTQRWIAGTGTKLYEAGASTWSDISGTAYAMSSTSRWRFAQQGNVTLGVNNTSTIVASTGSAVSFTVIAGGPVAALTEVVGQFALVANTSVSTSQWRCSALGDYTSWTAAVATQATSGLLTDAPGPLTGLKRFGGAVVAFKKSAMFYGVYVGAPTVWDFKQIPGEVGAMTQEAIANIGTPENPKLIFMGADDFYVFDGSRPVPIGTNRVREQVFNSLQQSRYFACAAHHDKAKSIVRFWYPVTDTMMPDKCVVYNYRTDKWGRDDRQIQLPTDYALAGVSYDGLGGQYATYADLPNLPYDSAFQSNSQTLPGIFDTTGTVKTLTGPAATTSLTTGDFGDDVQFATVIRIRPRFITAPSSGSMTNYYRNNLGDSLTTDTTTLLANSVFDVIREARWHRLSFSFAGDWEMPAFNIEGEDGSFE